MANNSIELCRMPVDHVCWSDCDPAADEHYHPPIGNEVEQMKPCPFCPNGGKPWAWRSHDPKADNRIVWCIACESCACEGPEAATESEAAKLWNTRASTTSPPLTPEQAKEMAREIATSDWYHRSLPVKQSELLSLTSRIASKLMAVAISPVADCQCVVWAQHGVQHPRGHVESGCAFAPSPVVGEPSSPAALSLLLKQLTEREPPFASQCPLCQWGGADSHRSDCPFVLAKEVSPAPSTSVQSTGWRDIESAPKDGAPILVTDGIEVWQDEWSKDYHGWTRCDGEIVLIKWQPLPPLPAPPELEE